MGGRRTVPIEATAYSSDWRSCGWEWGLALGPLPLYLPLCAGVRPSGTVAWPLVPRRRREKVEDKPALVLGGPRNAMFANLVFEAVITQLNWPLGSALSLMLLAILGGLVLIYNHFLGMAQLMKGLG